MPSVTVAVAREAGDLRGQGHNWAMILTHFGLTHGQLKTLQRKIAAQTVGEVAAVDDAPVPAVAMLDAREAALLRLVAESARRCRCPFCATLLLHLDTQVDVRCTRCRAVLTFRPDLATDVALPADAPTPADASHLAPPSAAT